MSRLLINVTEKEEFHLDSEGNIESKEVKGQLLIRNPSSKSKVWAINLTASENVENTTLDPEQLQKKELGPMDEWVTDYTVIKPVEFPNIVIEEEIGRRAIIHGEPNQVKILVTLFNQSDWVISTQIIREIPDWFDDIDLIRARTIDESSGHVRHYLGTESEFIIFSGQEMIWDDLVLEPNEKAELIFTAKITPTEIKDYGLGNTKIKFSISGISLSGIFIEGIAQGKVSTFLDSEEKIEPGKWHCTFLFENTGDHLILLSDVEIFHVDEQGEKIKLVQVSPEEILHPDKLFMYEFDVNSETIPVFEKNLKYSLISDFKATTVGEILKKEKSCSVLRLSSRKIFSPPTIYSSEGERIEASIRLENTGNAKIGKILIKDFVPVFFEPPDKLKITINDRGIANFESKLEPNDLDPNKDHNLLIEIRDEFNPGEELNVRYELISHYPSPNLKYSTPIYVEGYSIDNILYVSNYETDIKVHEFVKRVKVEKNVRKSLERLGTLKVEISVTSSTGETLDNIKILDMIPKPFELDLFPSTPEVSLLEKKETEEGTTLVVTIMLLGPLDIKKIEYFIKSTEEGEYEFVEPEQIP